MKVKKTFVFIMFFLTGIILGSLLTELITHVAPLKFLVSSLQVGIGYPTPITLDLSVVKLSFGFGVDINIIKMVSILLCLWLSMRFSKEF